MYLIQGKVPKELLHTLNTANPGEIDTIINTYYQGLGRMP